MWFGAVMITVIVGTFVMGEFARRHEHTDPPLRRPLDTIVSEYAKSAAQEYERGSQAALIAELDRIQRESNLRGFLFNSELHELSGRRVPSGAQDLAKQVYEKRSPEVGSDGPPPLMAWPALTSAGDQYVLVVEMPRRSPPGLLHPISHVLAMTFIGGLFCYGLARYLTSPVSKLRTATRELAGGNLGARVGPSLGKRRDELASLGADFDVMAQKIQSLVDSQRRLLGDISHELRSPLARLNVALELARQRSGAEATTALERIQREAEILNEMIGQLLALTRLESGAEEIKKAEFDLGLLVRDIAADADFEARSRNRLVTLESAESCSIVGNEQLLRRAIENVVRNAVQYTAEDTEVVVRLEYQVNEQENDSGPDKRAAVITVRDHGGGVPEAALVQIFRPFYRVDEARDREAGGVGLGLAIAERAVRLHSGSVQAANVPTGGLSVTIVLPVRPDNK
jgi:two-component system sensor histidine kinase CpxA